jgi:hypothetical protein
MCFQHFAQEGTKVNPIRMAEYSRSVCVKEGVRERVCVCEREEREGGRNKEMNTNV